nr:MAG TPA: hypothetical protein [Caudoviricetes sp.]
MQVNKVFATKRSENNKIIPIFFLHNIWKVCNFAKCYETIVSLHTRKNGYVKTTDKEQIKQNKKW